MKFGKRLGSRAAETPAKFHSDGELIDISSLRDIARSYDAILKRVPASNLQGNSLPDVSCQRPGDRCWVVCSGRFGRCCPLYLCHAVTPVVPLVRRRMNDKAELQTINTRDADAGVHRHVAWLLI